MSTVWPDWMSRRRAQKRGPSDAQVVFDVGDGLFCPDRIERKQARN